MNLKSRRLVIPLVAFAALMPSNAAAALVSPNIAVPTDPTCDVYADVPHRSTGGIDESLQGTVDAKTRFKCDAGTTKTMKITEVLINIYYCGSQEPAGTESDWTSKYGCRVVASAHYFDTFTVTPGTQTTRMAPPKGTPGPTMAGWYIQCTQYVKNGVAGRRGSLPKEVV